MILRSRTGETCPMRNPVLSRFFKIFGWLALALLIANGPQFLVTPAMAQHGHGGGPGGGHGGGGRGGGWHGDGGWHGGWYGGVGIGWWGWPYYGGWPYYLDWPYYPYAYYPPPVYQAPVVMPQAPATAAQSSFWYYCANPKGYYPYVQSCQGAWQPVPAVPPGAVPGAQH